jgi:hypothetical protein
MGKRNIHVARMRARAKYRSIGHRKWESSRVYQRSGLARSWTVERSKWVTWMGSKRVSEELISAVQLGRGPKGDDPNGRFWNAEIFVSD